MNIVRRHPLVSFFVLSYLLTWSLVPIGSFLAGGPLFAALIIIGLTQGRAGFRQLGRRLIRWRVSWIWYALAVGVPLSVHALTIGANVALGAEAPSLAQLSPLSGVLLIFAVRLINPLDGPLGEEPGWRGFAQPGLEARRSPFVATMILGLLVAGWHLPLWLLPSFGAAPTDVISDSLGSFAVTFWYAWLFNRTGGSLLLPILAHAVEGSLQTSQYWTTGAAADRTSLTYAVVWGVVAVALVVGDRRLWWPDRELESDRPSSGPATHARVVAAHTSP